MTSKVYGPNVFFKTAEYFQGPLSYGSSGAAGIDLRLPEDLLIFPGEKKTVRTGLFLDMSESPNMAAILLPRSGLGSRGLSIANTIGLIDSDYQGEVMVKLINVNKISERFVTPMNSDSPGVFDLKKGERFCQMMFIPVITPFFEKVEQFESLTDRGAGGFGSTGT